MQQLGQRQGDHREVHTSAFGREPARAHPADKTTQGADQRQQRCWQQAMTIERVHRVQRGKRADAKVRRVAKRKHAALPAQQVKGTGKQGRDQHLNGRVDHRHRYNSGHHDEGQQQDQQQDFCEFHGLPLLAH